TNRRTSKRTAQCASAGRPHTGQNLQPTSSSEPHAGQFNVVTFWPQCGQNVIGRPIGSTSLQARHRSPASGVIARDLDGAVMSGAPRGSSGGNSTFVLGRMPLDDARGGGSSGGAGGAAGGAAGRTSAVAGSGTATGRNGVDGSSGPASRLRSAF